MVVAFFGCKKIQESCNAQSNVLQLLILLFISVPLEYTSTKDFFLHGLGTNMGE